MVEQLLSAFGDKMIINSYRYAGVGGIEIPNLEAWWELNETSGTLFDAHASNDLTNDSNAAPAFTTGKQGNAADFIFSSNTGKHIPAPIDSSLQFADEDFTIAGWVRFDRLVEGEFNPTVAQRDGTDICYEIGQNFEVGTHNVYWRVTDGTTTGIVRSETVSQGNWYFIIAEHDSVADTVSVSIDNGTPSSVAYSAGCRNSSGAEFAMGVIYHLRSASNIYHLDGPMDEWLVARQILNSATKEWLFNSGSGRSYSDFSAL